MYSAPNPLEHQVGEFRRSSALKKSSETSSHHRPLEEQVYDNIQYMSTYLSYTKSRRCRSVFDVKPSDMVVIRTMGYAILRIRSYSGLMLSSSDARRCVIPISGVGYLALAIRQSPMSNTICTRMKTLLEERMVLTPLKLHCRYHLVLPSEDMREISTPGRHRHTTNLIKRTLTAHDAKRDEEGA